MASRKKSKNISGKPELPNSISITTSFCSSFRLIFTFAFRKTLIESKYKHILPPHRRASRRARITWLTDFDWHSHSRSQSVFPVHQRTDYSKMLVCRQAVILVPSPSPFPPIFHLLLHLFNMAPEIEFASSDFPPSHKTASYAGYGTASARDWTEHECEVWIQDHTYVHTTQTDLGYCWHRGPIRNMSLLASLTAIILGFANSKLNQTSHMYGLKGDN